MSRVRDAAFCPDGRTLLVASQTGTVWRLDAATGKVVTGYDWQIGGITRVAVSGDGLMAAAGSDQGKVVVWDLDG